MSATVVTKDEVIIIRVTGEQRRLNRGQTGAADGALRQSGICIGIVGAPASS